MKMWNNYVITFILKKKKKKLNQRSACHIEFDDQFTGKTTTAGAEK